MNAQQNTTALRIDQAACTQCGQCLAACPFGALSMADGQVVVGPECRLCHLCIKACPAQAIRLEDAPRAAVDKAAWNGMLVFAEARGDELHPVTLELLGKARALAAKVGHPVLAVLAGAGEALSGMAQVLASHGADRILVYDDPALAHFRADAYADVLEDAVGRLKPSVVLVGATTTGRSLAPRVATRFRTGLTADCTTLDILPDTDLVQIRPAFGGNIMAEIHTPHTRPQFATVRWKVMATALPVANPNGVVERCTLPPGKGVSGIRVLEVRHKPPVESITEADVLVVAGRGLKDRKDLDMLQTLADLLGGQLACTRGLVEDGWMHHTRQIGLSGRTVKPRLIITCGVSGAVQFTAGMNASERIVAINRDRNAPIFKVAHHGLVADLYEVVPTLIESLRRVKAEEREALHV